MKPDWPRVRDLFERAIDLNAADVRAWLDREAAGDPRIHAEVLSLLAHHNLAGAFLVEPPDLVPIDHPALEPGRVIGPYTIVRETGRGGMGRVYQARDTRLGRTVALKAVRTIAGPVERERLRREAQAAARLVHPGICTVYALEEIEGDLYIASEFVEGRTLRREIAGGERPTGPALLQMAREIADALASAHEAGITHGDLKPENVMRGHSGRLKILDFGLARFEFGTASGTQSPGETQTGVIAGTPGYMSPEQLNGGRRSARGDVFAFGVLMYECASGRHPFDASTPLEMAARVLESAVVPILTIRPDVPVSLGRVIERCLKKNPADRFSSAGQVVEALTGDHLEAPRGRVATWWRVHQAIVMGLYSVAAVAAWQIRELQAGATTAVFLAIGVAATTAAVFRGHLLFTERMNGGRLKAERLRSAPITLTMDLLVALGLAIDGALLASRFPLPALLSVALGVCLALARLVLEPSTTAAAFDQD